ncbi:hypothetical protein AMATHDRAFT_73867 [Amanita thiersii Skay4041]|uniref:Uncharacterized protein n=1 Tax=Amanita thiersii Skay4041 TaxID=703135 RepID=A0A2A9NTQ5_9AGAR|nr:hypothetical protein AMATHDRAFT_73867 [Amanita thiersii Skay4041]
MLSLFLLLNILTIGELYATPVQIPLQLEHNSQTSRNLRGRFLHITDMHPDPFYTPHASIKKACHRKQKQKGAGYYGTPYAECDSPFALTNFTLDYLEKNWASEIDFVIWTGDNARHDNDPKIPRTLEEILDLNNAVAMKMKSHFLDKGIPVIPSLAHNIMAAGPNAITNGLARIWEPFIPQEDIEIFKHRAHFSVEVVPHKVAVISLNTIYFYDSNEGKNHSLRRGIRVKVAIAVLGCSYSVPEDPGNLQLDWLETRLKHYKDRGIYVGFNFMRYKPREMLTRDMFTQVWLSGHVPPSPGNYFPECYVRYVDLALRYQGTILGHLYGHMNIDHFFFLERIDLQIITELKARRWEDEELYETLMNEFSALPSSLEDANLDDYAVVNVAPAVVPHPYIPAFRVYAYNVTAEEAPDKVRAERDRNHRHERGDYADKTTECSRAPWRDTWKCHLNETRESEPESPSRSNRRWTGLGYAQYYASNLAKTNGEEEPVYELEYMTFAREGVREEGLIPGRHLPREIGQYTPYGMRDLTIGSWVLLGQRLGLGRECGLRRAFRDYMYVRG